VSAWEIGLCDCWPVGQWREQAERLERVPAELSVGLDINYLLEFRSRFRPIAEFRKHARAREKWTAARSSARSRGTFCDSLA